MLLTNNCVCTCQQAPICFPRLSLGHGGFSQSPCGIPCGIVPNRPKNLRRTFHPQTLRCKWHMCLAYTGPPVHSPCTGAAKEFSYLHVGIPDTAPLPTPRRTGACQQQCPDPLPRSAAAAPAPAHLRAPARPCPAGPNTQIGVQHTDLQVHTSICVHVREKYTQSFSEAQPLSSQNLVL